MMRSGRLSLLAVVLLAVCLQHASAATSSTCQKAYVLLKQCPLAGGGQAPGSGCCALTAAFETRRCLEVDSRIRSMGRKPSRTLKSLAAACTEAEQAAATTVSVEIGGDAATVKPVMEALASLASDAMVAQEGDPDGMPQLHDISVEYSEDSPASCACTGIQLAPPQQGEAWTTALRRRYVQARLWLCQFTCQHFKLVLGAMLMQIAFLGLWIVMLLSRSRAGRGRRSATRAAPQFLVHAADFVDQEWQAPLLSPEERGDDLEENYRYP